MIRLVTFDLDNTLWSLDGVIRRAEAEMNAWLHMRAPAYGDLPRAHKEAIRDRVINDTPGIVHDISLLRETVLRAVLEHCGEAPARAGELAAGAFAEFLAWRHRVEFFPDALDVLASLASRYTLASLTNGNADFQRLGLDRYFAFGYCAADVGASKPHTAMFERAIDRAGVTPTEAVHIGDHPRDDIQGATAAGMATVWVNRERSDEAASATVTVTSLAELPAAIASLDGERAT